MANLIYVTLKDVDNDICNKTFLISSDILTKEKISQLREIEEHWHDWDLDEDENVTEGHNWSFDISDYDRDSSSYNTLYEYLVNMEEESMGATVKISKESLTFKG